VGGVLVEPDLDHAALAEHLRRGWGLQPRTISFLPVGHDASAWAYDVHTEPGRRYFVKVRTRPAPTAAALVPRLLRERGLDQAVAPLPTLDGQPWWPADRLQLGVYPYVDGTTAWQPGLSATQWTAYGKFLGGLHRVELPPDVARLVPAETFVCEAVAEAATLAERIGVTGLTDRWQREFAGHWHRRRDEIAELAERTSRLGARARGQGLPVVLCHADIHLGNVIVDGSGGLFVVDWDAPMRAPAEKDLVLVLSGLSGEHAASAEQIARFRRGYGPRQVDPVALEYYRCVRRLEDITSFAANLLRDDVGEAIRRDDLYWFVRQFSP
jgi:spectinomycin phosphotransferase